MADTTPSKVKLIASHLEGIPDESLLLYIEDAKLELTRKAYDIEYEEKLQRYYTAHFATLDIRRPKSEKIANQISASYEKKTGEKGLELTEYGQEIKRILDEMSGPNIVVIS